MTAQTPQPNEKRRFSRIHFDADLLLTNGDKSWRTKLLDISLNGILARIPQGWDGVPGERYGVEVIFAERGALINGEVAVAHTEKDHIGFRIIGIDVDSVAHLKRLIELNLGDASLLDRELTALHWQ